MLKNIYYSEPISFMEQSVNPERIESYDGWKSWDFHLSDITYL